MKLVIPSDTTVGLDSSVAQHFGRCVAFTFLDGEGKLIEIIDNTSQHRGGKGLPPELMKQHGADILLCSDLGPSALDMCTTFGITVYVGHAATVRHMFEQWKQGRLTKAGPQDACSDHKK
jgi:predicted Fe-Mo cluster-binding NifX family protein